jgi:hypothetical protein
LRLIRRFLPGFLERVVKRLQIVSSQKADLEEKMHIEDEYLKVLEERDNVISYLQAQVEEKQQELEEKDKALEQEKQRVEQEHKKLLETAKLLLSLGVSIEIIKEKTGLTQEEIEKL